MGRIDDIESRIHRLEEMVDALVVAVNKMMDDIYEPGFVSKLDNMAKVSCDEGPEG